MLPPLPNPPLAYRLADGPGRYRTRRITSLASKVGPSGTSSVEPTAATVENVSSSHSHRGTSSTTASSASALTVQSGSKGSTSSATVAPDANKALAKATFKKLGSQYMKHQVPPSPDDMKTILSLKSCITW